MIYPGNFKDKARPRLVLFVLGCILIVTGLLWINVKSEATGKQMSSVLKYGSEPDPF